ncbi:unnamed protein product [Linum trigynum]|uniref:DNA topoisomerase (ATP-hydrolyzing) n=1 Tax=Linum trigynum TaxID=586398 RepID=A0AAV2ETD9_9ROSI
MDLTLLSACEESPLLLSESVHFGSDILATAGEIDLHNVLTKRIFLSALHFRINTRYKASAASAFIVRICRLLQSNWITVIMEGKVIMLQLQEALAEAVLLADLEQDTVRACLILRTLTFSCSSSNFVIEWLFWITVGMATNIPPHNLGELVNVLCTLIHNPEATLQELLEYMPGPDFAYWRSNYGKSRSIDGVTDIRDESDRTGMRIVIELKRGAKPALVLNKLYRLTQLQSSFTRNMVGILDGQPKLMGLKELLQTFLDVRCSVVERRARFKLSQAQEKRHIVEGIVVGLDNLDHIIQIIKEASSNAAASTSLMNEFNISSKQAEAILDISLRRLIHMERSKYVDEKKSLTEQISKLEELLASKGKMLQLIEQEAVELKHKFSNPRRSILEYSDDGQLEDINAIPNEEILLAISEKGYVNRMKPNTFNLQKRGTIGKSVGKLRVNNAMSDFMVCRSHDHILYLRYSHHAFSKSQVVVMFSEEEWHLAAVFVVGFSLTEDFESDEQVVLVSQSGTVNRIKVRDISIQSRYARGVILMRLEYAGKIQLASLISAAEAEAEDETTGTTIEDEAAGPVLMVSQPSDPNLEYGDELGAALAYDRAINRIHNAKAKLNFPPLVGTNGWELGRVVGTGSSKQRVGGVVAEVETTPSEVGSEGRFLVRGPWEETVELIKAYHDKWFAINRGNLLAAKWDTATIALADSPAPSDPPKSTVQCRHKIEKIRKCYHTEKQRCINFPGQFFSSWDLFPLLDVTS